MDFDFAEAKATEPEANGEQLRRPVGRPHLPYLLWGLLMGCRLVLDEPAQRTALAASKARPG